MDLNFFYVISGYSMQGTVRFDCHPTPTLPHKDIAI